MVVVAAVAIEMNAKLNSVQTTLSVSAEESHYHVLHPGFQICSASLLGHYNPLWDIILLGDMFYDSEFADMLCNWLKDMAKQHVSIYIGDPGRGFLEKHDISKCLRKVAEYELSLECKIENSGLSTGCVWTFSGL